MHHKYAKDGLVVLSVALDDIHEDPPSKDRALKFLNAKGATFTNLLLDEPVEFWQEKLRFIAPPCHYVFSRQGKWIQFTSDKKAIDHDAVEKLVVELLREK
jgi:hypothetical protein